MISAAAVRILKSKQTDIYLKYICLDDSCLDCEIKLDGYLFDF